MDLQGLLNTKLVTPNVDSNSGKVSIAIVTEAYEKDNVCDIIYTDKHGKIQRRERVEMKILDPDSSWFPKAGETVEIQFYDEYVYITGAFVLNYRQYMSNKNIDNDIYSESSDSSVGCYIF